MIWILILGWLACGLVVCLGEARSQGKMTLSEVCLVLSGPPGLLSLIVGTLLWRFFEWADTKVLWQRKEPASGRASTRGLTRIRGRKSLNEDHQEGL